MSKEYGKTIQLWPGGSSVTFLAILVSAWAPATRNGSLRVKNKAGRWVKPSPELTRKIRIETLAEMYAERDILHCDSHLVSDMMQHHYDMPSEVGNEWDYEKVVNLTADPSDWSLEQCREWLDDNNVGHPDPDPWAWEGEDYEQAELLCLLDRDPDDAELFDDDQKEEYKQLKRLSMEKLRAEVARRIEDEEIDGLEAFREAVQDNASDHQQEPYEWWRVSDWLAKQLMAIGECVLDNNYGYWWGRCATGQGFIMDGVLQRVAAQYA